MEIHISDYYNNKTGHALNNIVERLAKKRKIKVYTSNKNIFEIPYNDKESSAEIIRFRGLKIGSKTIFPGVIPFLLFKKLEIVHSYVMGFFSTFVIGYLRKIKNFKMVLFSDFDEAIPLPKGFFSKLGWYFFVKIPAKSSDIITVFTKQQKKYLSKLLDYPENKIKIVPSGVDFNLFQKNKTKKQIRKELKLSQSKFIIINVGNFGRKRQYELTLEILENLSDKNVLFLHIGGIGDKKYYKEIQKFIKKRKLEKNVLFLGAKPFEKIVDYYLASDCFLLTSNNESFGIPIIESMAAGLPVITTEELYKNKKLREKISKNAKKTAKKYDWEEIIKKIESIYKKLID